MAKPATRDGYTDQYTADCERVLVTLLRGGNEVLAAIFNPFYRALQQHCCQGDRRVFRIKNKLWTESAADIRRDNPDLVLLAAQNLTKQLPSCMRRLG